MLCTAILLITGCASLPSQYEFPEPGQEFRSSKEEALVFGRLEVLLDGYPLPLNPSSMRIFPLALLVENRIKVSHAYLVDISSQNGYFFMTLPPGKYAVHDITPRIKVGSPLHNMRAISKRVYGGSSDYNILESIPRNILIFEVIPEKTTYIGSIQAINDRYLRIDKWVIQSDYEKAKRVLSTFYREHTYPVESLVEIRPCREEKSKSILMSYICLPIEGN